MNILWFLPKWPNPPTDGATKAHMALLEDWPADKASLTLAIYSDEKTQEEIDLLKKITRAKSIILLPYDHASKAKIIIKSFFTNDPLPATTKKFTHKKVPILLGDLEVYSHLVFDGLHPSALFYKKERFNFPKKAKIIYRAHNLESELWEQVKERSHPFVRFIYREQHKKMYAFEKTFFKTCKWIATVSKRDSEKLLELYGNFSVKTIPIGMNWENDFVPLKKEMRILFIGRLDWWPNNEGLTWFLNNVWPKVLDARPNLFLDIVGGFAIPELERKIKESKNVVFHGKVPDVNSYYENAALTIIPIWTGSGTRVKAIESAKFGRTFLTTTKGIEGVELKPNEDFILSDDLETWIQTLAGLDLEKCERLGKQIYQKAKMIYDQKTIQNNFLTALEENK